MIEPMERFIRAFGDVQKPDFLWENKLKVFKDVVNFGYVLRRTFLFNIVSKKPIHKFLYNYTKQHEHTC